MYIPLYLAVAGFLAPSSDTVPPNAQIPHPSFHAIHTLLDPALVPQAVKDHYKDLTRAPELDEFLTHMKKQKGNSAPGPSKFRYSLLLKGPPSLHRLLHLLVCLCLRAEGLPAVLKQALLMPIPKSAGVFALDKMRPITLLEIGYKLTTGWVAQKMRKLHQTAPSPLWDHDHSNTGETVVLTPPSSVSHPPLKTPVTSHVKKSGRA